MLYKNTLGKLKSEMGVCYFDLDQVDSALRVCDDTSYAYNLEINSIMCFHNGILDELFKYNVISADERNFYYDKPSYIYILKYLENSINYYLKNNLNNNYKKQIMKVQKRVQILKENIKNDKNLIKITKPLVRKMKSSYKEDLKELKVQRKALTYAKKRIKRKEKENEKL